MEVKEMVSVLKTQGKFKTNPLIFESALYYNTAIVMNMMNIVRRDEEKESLINYYSLILSGSGSGKDFAFDTVADLFSLPEDVYTSGRKSGFEENSKDKTGGTYFDDDLEKIRESLPKSITLGLEGTKEGLFAVCKAQSISNFGSLNLTHGEFGDIITKSSELLSGLKELYDGKMSAKIIKSANVEKIENLPVNLMAYGSHAGIAHEARDNLLQLVKSGMFRRTYIIDLPNKKIVKQDASIPMLSLEIYISALVDRVAKKFNSEYRLAKSNLFVIEHVKRPEAERALSDIFDEILEESNQDVNNDIKKAEVGAMTMIENLSHIISFLEGATHVEEEHVLKAYDFYKRCRETTTETFAINHPYMTMFTMLKERPKMSMSEMTRLDNSIPTAKSRIDDQMTLLEEHSYIKGQKLMTHSGKVTRYSIVELPSNDNSEIIVSINMDGKGKHSVDYNLVGVPFFGKHPKHSIESLVASPDIESFLTVEVKPSAKAIHGHRKDENAVEGQNMLAFDIDEGMTIDEATAKLDKYTYILYTTKSHRKDKGGVVCDRFRVLMPTKQKFFVDAEAHKQLYENVSELIGFQVYDKSTRNISRFWFTNKGAEVMTNDGENIDVSTMMPETEAEKVFSQRLEQVDERFNDASVRGIYKWFFANTDSGNRNDHIFRLGCYVRDLGEDSDYHIDYVNAMLDNPLPEGEISNIRKSVHR